MFQFKYIVKKIYIWGEINMYTGITQAIRELKQAEQNFENADPEFVDIAIIQLLAAKMKVNLFYTLRKQNVHLDPSETNFKE